MGLAASQARLLMLTARIHDVEYQAQMIQSAKLQLATQEDEVCRKYTEALDATTLTFTNDQKNVVAANFNNLCGLASINNGLNKNYVFRTGDDDRLIVPSDVYNGYQEYGGDDPYAFAMYMMVREMGIQVNELSNAESEYLENRTQSGVSDNLANLKETMDDKVRAIANKVGFDPDDTLKDINDGESVTALLPDEDDSNYSSVKKLVDEYQALKEEFRYKLYQKGGAANIYSLASGEDTENFDQNKFNYYLRWGKMIEQEVGLRYCVSETDYSPDFGNDAETFNQMIQSGRITVDVVNIDKKGKLTDDATSVASDSNFAYTPTSTIDKQALAKAEAEYEHNMKKIDRKDKQYDMDLNKLETERTALTTEYDSVKKVIQDNIERTFGIFS